MATACTRTAPPEPPAALWFGGDVFLGAGDEPLLGPLADTLRQGLGVVNLEGPVGQGGAVRTADTIVLTHAPAALDPLAALGVAAASLANNHADDAGTDGPRRTAETLSARGIQPFGGPAGSAVLTIGATTVSLSGYTLPTTAPLSLPGADLRVASFHVVSDTPAPTAELVDAVDAAIDAGAQVVVAHGTHTIGRLERRRGAVVAWGLGNLAFACDCTDATDGIVLRVVVGTDPPVASVVPIAVGRTGAPARLHPDPDAIYDRLEALGSPALVRGDGAAAF